MVISGLPPITSPESRILILGTMPGERSLQTGEYYAHPANQFRKLVSGALSEMTPSSFHEFTVLLKKHRIALWNVVASCERKGSADSGIRDARPNDIPGFLDAHPRIRFVFFESITARKWHDRFFERADGVTYQTLPSSSGQYARMSFSEKLAVWSGALHVAKSNMGP